MACALARPWRGAGAAGGDQALGFARHRLLPPATSASGATPISLAPAAIKPPPSPPRALQRWPRWRASRSRNGKRLCCCASTCPRSCAWPSATMALRPGQRRHAGARRAPVIPWAVLACSSASTTPWYASLDVRLYGSLRPAAAVASVGSLSAAQLCPRHPAADATQRPIGWYGPAQRGAAAWRPIARWPAPPPTSAPPTSSPGMPRTTTAYQDCNLWEDLGGDFVPCEAGTHCQLAPDWRGLPQLPGRLLAGGSAGPGATSEAFDIGQRRPAR